MLRRDLEDVREELKAEIANVRKDMKMIRNGVIITFCCMIVVVAAVGVLAIIIKHPF